MQDFEKLGVFYLGRVYDRAAGRPTEEPILYDAKDLTTHAVAVGMTGSGKTGLCVSLLEEAAIDGIPAIVIDPKGDLGNILLAFPELRSEDFLPWIDPAEAARKELSPEDLAAKTAAVWRAGLAAWGQDPSRIARLRSSVDLALYTPGASGGRGLAVLRSLKAPPPAVAADRASVRDRSTTAAGAILGLVGLAADPIQSRECILVATIIDRAWGEGRDLDLPALIREVGKPPFEKVGVFDLESFFPAKDRFELALRLNNLLAAPGFADWLEGEPLEVQRLLYTPEGKPRLSVISIAHLGDEERMFFVTLLLGEVIAWMRAQSGTSSLRAILYMDEIFGYFPPVGNPPSKAPMLTLLKQARAYGLGVVLATQNPVDLDYKGLANAGTWFVGRLQTERDKARLMDGLEGGAATTGGTFDRRATEEILAGLGERVFLLRNVHEDRPVLFQTRWALSYLRGPLTLPQIRTLVGPAVPPVTRSPGVAPSASSTSRPVTPSTARERFVAPLLGDGPPGAGSGVPREVVYVPRVLGSARLHFVDVKRGVDVWEDVSLLAPLSDDGREALWAEAECLRGATAKALAARFEGGPREGARFGELPSSAASPKASDAWTRSLRDHLYRAATLPLIAAPALKLVSLPGEAEGRFRARLALCAREGRDAALDALRKKYAPKLAALEDRIRRAEERVEREREQYAGRKVETVISVGASLLGALLGRSVVSKGNVGRAASAARSASRVSRERGDVERARESVEVLRSDLAALQAEFDAEASRLAEEWAPETIAVETMEIPPRKSDISLGEVALAWVG